MGGRRLAAKMEEKQTVKGIEIDWDNNNNLLIRGYKCFTIIIIEKTKTNKNINEMVITTDIYFMRTETRILSSLINSKGHRRPVKLLTPTLHLRLKVSTEDLNHNFYCKESIFHIYTATERRGIYLYAKLLYSSNIYLNNLI